MTPDLFQLITEQLDWVQLSELGLTCRLFFAWARREVAQRPHLMGCWEHILLLQIRPHLDRVQLWRAMHLLRELDPESHLPCASNCVSLLLLFECYRWRSFCHFYPAMRRYRWVSHLLGA